MYRGSEKMFVFLVLALAWFLVTVRYIYKGHYMAGIWNAIIGLYELSGPFFYYFPFFSQLSLAQRQYERHIINDNMIVNYMGWLFVVFIIMNLCYWLFIYVTPFNIITKNMQLENEPHIFDDNRTYVLLLAFVFIMGLVSMFSGAGEAWRSYYDVRDISMANPISPAHNYGRVLLVSVVCLIFTSLYKKNYKVLVIQILAILPITLEIFISGRRSSFGPSLLLVILSISYLRDLKYKKLILIISVALMLVVTSAQFLLRASYYHDTYGLYGIDFILKPVFGEFVSIGATSLNTYMLVGDNELTLGLHYLTSIFDAIPYVKFGGVFADMVNASVSSDYRILSPYGGFSMLADAYLAFGRAGYLFLPVAFGIFMALAHAFFRHYCINSLVVNRISLFYYGFIPLVMMQYRVGVISAMKIIVSYIVFYIVTVIITDVFIIRRKAERNDYTAVERQRISEGL